MTKFPEQSKPCPKCGRLVVKEVFQDSGEFGDRPFLDSEYYCKCGYSWVENPDCPEPCPNQIILDHDFVDIFRTGNQVYVNTWLDEKIDTEMIEGYMRETARARLIAKETR